MATKKEQVKEELAPPMEVASKEDLSAFKIKDEHFNKTKTYIDRKSKQQQELEADWRNININGQQMVVYKGQPLTKKQYRAFEVSAADLDVEKERKKNQQAYWLDKVK